MTRSVIRWTLAGCMAAAALSAAAVLDVGSATAEAAPGVSQFAGTYSGPDPDGLVSRWTITIDEAGQLSARSGDDRISGRVGADGRYSLTVRATVLVFGRGREPDLVLKTVQYKSTGSLSPDAAGNLVGTDDDGGSFVWTRQ